MCLYFRAKLAESELMVERLKRSRPASVSRVSLTPMLSPVSSRMSQSMESPMSPDNHITSIIEEAKRDVKRLKKKKKAAERHEWVMFSNLLYNEISIIKCIYDIYCLGDCIYQNI